MKMLGKSGKFMILDKLKILLNEGIIAALDFEFGRFLRRLDSVADDAVILGGVLAAYMSRQGHVCIDLQQVTGKFIFQNKLKNKCEIDIKAPPVKQWIEVLRESKLVGLPGTYRPLILDDRGRLYLYRYWKYERDLAHQILQKITSEVDDIDFDLLRDGLNRFFDPMEVTDWQKVAAITALTQKFCIISGGPGTGKTSTVVKILALMLEQDVRQENHLNIGLAAPTGKAAARLNESITNAKAQLNCSDEIKQAIPENATTLHRLLGARWRSSRFKHHRDNPLHHDVLVVDEASMVDLALMSKLLDATPDHTKIILLGDRDQLASVEAGAVLGDLCGNIRQNQFTRNFWDLLVQRCDIELPHQSITDQNWPLTNAIVHLKKSYRFARDSGIKILSDAVNTDNVEQALSALNAADKNDVMLADYDKKEDFTEALKILVIQHFETYMNRREPRQILEDFNRFRILCAHRRGPLGSEQINDTVDEMIRTRFGIPRSKQWFAGKPIMISQNDYTIKLRNGDIGIALPNPEQNGELYIYFLSEDQSIRKIPPSRLPAYETVFATTVHKSQGSEFDKVLLIMPNKVSEILTRELFYTAITRAKEQFTVWGREGLIRKTISQQIKRSSGLRDRLWEEPKFKSNKNINLKDNDTSGQLDLWS